MQAVGLQGASVPVGGIYSTFQFDPVLNGNGLVAFRADPTSGSSSWGIIVGTPGAVQAAALQGTAAPGGGDFGTFPISPQLNGVDQVAFVATLTGTGVDTTNDRGLYAGSVGALVKLVREGDAVDVDPGAGVDLRTVSGIGIKGEFETSSGGEGGRGVSFTDNGFVSYTLTFTDGSSGVFVSSLAPVPEPTTIGLVAGLGLAVTGWLGRRRDRRAGRCP